MNGLDAVIFDFDGVIADTRADVWESVEYGANMAGGVMDPEFMSDDSHVSLTEWELFSQVVPKPSMERFEGFCHGIKVHYRTMNQFGRTRIYPGVGELLRLLTQKGTPWAVVSSKPEQALSRLLGVKGWGEMIPIRYSLDSMDGLDTKKALYKYLLEEESPLPESYMKGRHPICVGDTFSDVKAAHDCRLPVIGALYGDGDSEALLAERPELVVATGWELYELMKRLGLG